MKLLLFLIIIVVIYFIATQIKVVHLDTLPTDKKKELNDRLKMRTMLLSNHVKLSEPDKSKSRSKSNSNSNLRSKSNSNLRSNLNSNSNANFLHATELLDLIKSEHLNTKYQFNAATLPSTTKYINRDNMQTVKRHIKYITSNILEWNNLLDSELLSVRQIIPVLIVETHDEFIIKVYVELLYLNKTLHLRMSYYGQIIRTDDFINDGKDVFVLQLIEINPISGADFISNITAATGRNNDTFITMNDQLAYVDMVNLQHKNENI